VSSWAGSALPGEGEKEHLWAHDCGFKNLLGWVLVLVYLCMRLREDRVSKISKRQIQGRE